MLRTVIKPIIAFLREFEGHDIVMDIQSNNKIDISSIDTSERLLTVDKKQEKELYLHLINYTDHDISCVIETHKEVALESTDTSETILLFRGSE